MKKPLSILLCVTLALTVLAPAARGDVDVEREGSENPVLEVAKSTLWGALAGLVVGGAIALIDSDNDHNGDIVRWGFVGGTFLGMGYGIYHVSTRPEPTAMLQLQGGDLRLNAVLPAPEPGRGLTLRLFAVTF
jgi:hypothetical protein